MSTSGSTNFNLVGSEIVQLAFALIGVGREGEALPAEEAAEGLRRLNLMVKTWSAEGVRLWKKKNAILFTVASQANYSLGTSGNRSATTWAETTLDADEASGQTVLSVARTTGFSNSDVIGILLDDNTMHWTTISSFVTNDTVTVASALPSAASSGNKVFAYTSLMIRPLRILDAQRRDDADRDIPIFRLSREEYRELPTKTATGTPTQFYYDPQTSTGVMYLWPAPLDETNTIRFTAALPLEDFDLATNDPDAPSEWTEAIAYNLAVRLIPTYGDTLKGEDKQLLIAQANDLKEMLKGWDQDQASVTFEPAPRW